MDAIDPKARIAQLEAENAKLAKINRVLMNRVERSMDMQGSAFSLFQAATALESKVGERTEALEQAMSNLERSNEQLRVSMEAADAANRAKSRFLATMSHEIRTPLNGVLGMAELLESTTLDRRQRKLLDTIVNSGQSLLSLINDILDLSRIEAGRMELAYSDTSPRECVESVFDMLAERAREKHIELVSDIDAAVPDIINSDVLRLRQVLVNLIGNAVKFTERGAIVVTVDVETTSAAAMQLRFVVRDSGIGIADDKLARIFDPFTQADASTTRQHGGTGLGLAICQRLVELMGGTIVVKSEFGVGSTFTFTISAERKASSPELPIAHKLRDKHVLLAVDNSDLAEVIERQCRREGARVSRCVLNSQFDLIDVQGNRIANADALIVDEARYRLSALTLSVPPHPTLLLAQQMETDDLAIGIAQVERLVKPTKERDIIKALLRLCASATETCVLPTLRPESSSSLNADVLLVEDNDVNREVATGMLRGFGCRVVSAINGQDALEKWQAGKFDLILMDFQMPIMDGITATEIIRGKEDASSLERTPIVALTANAFEEDRTRAEQVGCDGFLTKPISRKVLFETLAKVLMLRRSKSTTQSNSTATTLQAKNSVKTISSDVEELIDVRMINEIKAIGQSDLLPRLIGMFVNDSAVKLDAIRSAIAGGDAKALFAAAHSLKSASANLGGKRVAALCRELEVAGKQGRIPENVESVEQLALQCAQLCEALRNLDGEQAA